MLTPSDMPLRHSVEAVAIRLLWPLVLTRGPRGSVYLTFDDGPHSECTPLILDVLDSHRVKATFFMIGSLIDKHRALAAEVVARGHTVGYHSYQHVHRGAHTIGSAIRDLETIRRFPGLLRTSIRHYRPPYGELSIIRILWCLVHGVRVAMWSLDSQDSTINRADELAQRVSPETVRDGDVILFHDDTRVTVEALPLILKNLKSAEFSFAAL